jgi:hypothetical protein
MRIFNQNPQVYRLGPGQGNIEEDEWGLCLVVMHGFSGFGQNFDTYPLHGMMVRPDASIDSSTFKVRKLFAAAN